MIVSSMLAKTFAVVGGDNKNRPSAPRLGSEKADQPLNLAIQVGQGFIVAVDKVLTFLAGVG